MGVSLFISTYFAYNEFMLANLTKFKFHLLLLIIAIFGLWLRFIDYDKIPAFLETADEVMYPWAGITFLQTGTPSSWTWNPSYKNGTHITLWGANFNIVTPWIEKPPLYSLITGLVSMLSGENQLDKVRISTIRLTPLILSFCSIILVGLLAKNFFGKQIALLAAFLYATVPTIVIANRLSLAENLLTPLALLALWMFNLEKEGRWQKLKPYLIGFVCGLSLLTRQFALVLPLTIIAILIIKKEIKQAIVISIISLIFGLTYPLIGLYYDWSLFIRLLNDFHNYYSYGMPQGIINIFRFPMITYKFNLFPDGSILASYLLLLTSPFIFKEKLEMLKLIFFPFAYLILISLLETGEFTFGWHLFPIFPFLAIILAKYLYDFWLNSTYLQALFIFLIIGFSTIRFFFLLSSQNQQSWQLLSVILLLLFSLTVLPRNENLRKITKTGLFIVYSIINVMVILNFNSIYPVVK